MDKARMGEIALLLLKYIAKQEGMKFRDDSQAKRRLGNIVKQTGIPRGELLDFLETFFKELFQETMATLRK